MSDEPDLPNMKPEPIYSHEEEMGCPLIPVAVFLCCIAAFFPYEACV